VSGADGFLDSLVKLGGGVDFDALMGLKIQ